MENDKIIQYIRQSYRMESKTIFAGLLFILFSIGCESSLQPIKEVEVELQPNLEYNDGYYYLQIDTTKHQTLHRIDGNINPNIEYKRIEWMSNLVWYDDGEVVPTINDRSYTDSNGQFSTMVAPTNNMRGDTMIIRYYYDTKDTSDSITDFVPNGRGKLHIILY